MRKKLLVRETAMLLMISIVYTLCIKMIDVSPVGPQNTKVGFSTINHFISMKIGYHETFYLISKILGMIPFVFILFYALIGLKQMIRKRSLLKVDNEILLLGLFYILVGLVYVFFEHVVINYRPIMFDGILEASYPSSHTMLALTIGLSSIIVNKKYITNSKVCDIINDICWVTMVLLVLTRTLSGVHWITDIIGGIIISLLLVSFYRLGLECMKRRKSR